jgi:pyruvate ferredoxin oxidoreductase alpha subunit
MRKNGEKVGYIKLRWFRPFASDDLRNVLSKANQIGIIDRDFAHGGPDDAGVLYNEIRAAMYKSNSRPAMIDFIAGLAGREISIEDVISMYHKTQRAREEETLVNWVRVRERQVPGVKIRE